MADAAAHHEASENPYYSLNTMKKIVCRLCNAMCRDDANFLVHLQGKPHRMNLEKAERRRRLAKLREQRNAADRAVNQTNSTVGNVAPNTTVVTPYGEPEYKTRVEHMPEMAATKVWVDAHFPKAADDTRPLHRWVNSYEQTQEPPQPGVVYLLIACQGYTTIALKFPKDFPRTNDRDALDGKYECRWDPLHKVFHLFFIIG